MAYKARNFDALLGMEGFSAKLLKDHFKLYAGYVAATNKLLERLGDDSLVNPERAELKRRLGWEFNGMRLHELYFDNMAPKAAETGRSAMMRDWLVGTLTRKIKAEFGGITRWETDFRSVGAMRGIGWAILYFDPASGRLFNAWIDEHDGGHLAGAAPILIMDVFEHAYLGDYGLNRADYIKAFLKAANWKAAAQRYKRSADV